MADEFQKPKPRVRAISVHELRGMVLARHKLVISQFSEEEAITFIRDNYGADDDSCKAFHAWLKGETVQTAEGPKQVTKNESLERLHVVVDPKTGDEKYVDTVPGSIPPRPARPKK